MFHFIIWNKKRVLMSSFFLNLPKIKDERNGAKDFKKSRFWAKYTLIVFLKDIKKWSIIYFVISKFHNRQKKMQTFCLQNFNFIIVLSQPLFFHAYYSYKHSDEVHYNKAVPIFFRNLTILFRFCSKSSGVT